MAYEYCVPGEQKWSRGKETEPYSQAGGRGGIRTLGALLEHTRFPGEPDRPLRHPSVYFPASPIQWGAARGISSGDVAGQPFARGWPGIAAQSATLRQWEVRQGKER